MAEIRMRDLLYLPAQSDARRLRLRALGYSDIDIDEHFERQEKAKQVRAEREARAKEEETLHQADVRTLHQHLQQHPTLWVTYLRQLNLYAEMGDREMGDVTGWYEQGRPYDEWDDDLEGPHSDGI